MAQLASITVNDRTSPTPVAIIFQPSGDPTNAGSSSLTTVDAVPLSRRLLSFSLKKIDKKYRFSLGLKYPTVVNEVINGVTQPKVVRTAVARVEFTFDESSSEQERADTVGMLANALASGQTVINASVVKLEGTW